MAITGANFRVDGLAPEVIEWIKQVKPGSQRRKGKIILAVANRRSEHP